MSAATIPVRTVSEMNAHTHWRIRSKRAKHQRGMAALVMRQQGPSPFIGEPLIVRLTRIAPRTLDSDNLSGSLKHIRDGIADWLGIDDRSPLVTWEYAQRKGAPKSYAVGVTVENHESTKCAEWQEVLP